MDLISVTSRESALLASRENAPSYGGQVTLVLDGYNSPTRGGRPRRSASLRPRRSLAPLLDIARHPDDFLGRLNKGCCRDTERLRGSQQETEGRLPFAALQFSVVRTVYVGA